MVANVPSERRDDRAAFPGHAFKRAWGRASSPNDADGDRERVGSSGPGKAITARIRDPYWRLLRSADQKM